MFFDQVKIHVKGGRGGNGASAFRREKFVPRGGPSGGHGGRGGHIIFQVDPDLNTLIRFKNQIHFRAENGTHGGGKNQRGAEGRDMLVPVPPGTMVRDADTGALLADLIKPDDQFIAANGGRGGRGNSAFKSSVRQAPRMAERGLDGEERWLVLELKLIADAGIVGLPNAGKSTLLASVTAAQPKIADYPFTTLQPNLGVVVVDHRDFVLADIPGLIEGAHSGAGLGHQFLRHVERTRLLIHLLDGASPDPVADLHQINEELTLYNPILAEKPQLIVLNKHDLPDAHTHWPNVQTEAEALGYPAYFVSAATQHGVRALMGEVLQTLDELPPIEPTPLDAVPVFTLDDEARFEIDIREDGYHVTGTAVAELVAQTYWNMEEAVLRAQGQLKQMGVLDALREAGVEAGDTVFLADLEMEWMW